MQNQLNNEHRITNNEHPMLKNYLKIAWRNLKQNKSYTLINFIGLTLGMTCCILIALYVKSELSYDDFNKNINRISAVGSYTKGFGKMMETPYPLANSLVNEVPVVRKAVPMHGTYHLYLSKDKKHYTLIKQGKYTESSFFDIFSFRLLKGNPKKALSAPNSIVLTQQTAKKLFGNKEAIGKSLYWQQSDTTKLMNVTGIVSNPPKHSSIQFGALVSMKTFFERYGSPTGWRSYMFNTFALLNKHASVDQFDASLHTIAKNHYKKDSTSTFFSIPYQSYHLSPLTYSQNGIFIGSSVLLYFFGAIALFILLIACINYVNLSTARASTRAREVGVRKTLGAGRKQIMLQFLGESVALSICSFLAGVYFSFMLVGPFNHLFGSSITFNSNFPLLGWLLLAAIIVGLLAGSYPALYLSGFAPASILSGQRFGNASRGWGRKVLVVVQFAIASIFIIGSAVVYRQLHYTQHVNLGFSGKQVAVFPFPKAQMWQNRNTVRQIVAGLPGVQKASVADGIPGDFGIMLGVAPKSISPDIHVNLGSKKYITFTPAVVDYNYLPTLGIKLLAGRNFSRSHPSDFAGSFILNKEAVNALGWTPKQAVGKEISFRDIKGKIVGVTQNFHITSLHSPIVPVLLTLTESKTWSAGGMLLAKLSADHISKTVAAIKRKLKSLAPHSVITYQFLDQKFAAMYRADRRLGEVIGLFAFIAVVIACLGLFGLATFATSRRTKEIGIRKVLGASEASIVRLLSKDFLKLVAIGFVIAVPIGWYAMHRWLQNFAYKINMSWWIFLLAGGIALVIALATVSWQSIRAALANPVDSLRNE
jgi:putative ABC transport system permease protein